MHTVAVTGVSGHVGQRLLRLLDADPSVGRVVGIDARDPLLRPPKLDFYRVDLGSADLKPLLDGVEVLVHLAFAVNPAHDAALLARVNVEGTRRLLDASGACGVRHLVYTSSAMVYGAWTDNPVPITEDAMVRPSPGFDYAVQKAETERRLAEWRADHPGATVAVLRPAAAPGAARRSWLARVWRGSTRLRVRGSAPPVQYVHEDDLAAAVDLAVRERLDGVFNVAPDGWIAGDEARALSGGLRVPLPGGIVRRVVALGWASGLSDISPAVLPYVEHPWVVANDRLRAAGWEPRHTNEEALVASSEVPAWRAFVGRHRQDVTLAAAGVGLAAGAAGLIALLRRRRRIRSAPRTPKAQLGRSRRVT